MTEEIKHPDRQAWWEKGKRFVLLTQIGQAVILLGGGAWWTYTIVKSEIREVLSTPKRASLIEHRQDSAFAAYDTLHSKQTFVTAPANHQSILTSKGF